MVSFKKTIGFRFWLICVLALTVPLSINITALVYSRYKRIMHEVKNNLIHNQKVKEIFLSQIAPLNKGIVVFLADVLDLDKNFPHSPDKDLSQKLDMFSSDHFKEISLIKPISNTEQIVVASNNLSLLGKNYSSFFPNTPQETLTIEIEKGDQINNDLYDTNDIFISIKHYIYDENNSLQGVLYALKVPDKTFNSLFKKNTSSYFTKTALFNDRFQIIFSPESELSSFSLETPLKRGFFNFSINKTKMWGNISFIPSLNTYLLSYLSKNLIFSLLRKILCLYCGYFLLILIGCYIGYVIAKKLSFSICHLEDVMTKVRKGNLKCRYQSSKLGFEMNSLGENFNHMLNSLIEEQKKEKEEKIENKLALKELKLGEKAQLALLNKIVSSHDNIDITKIYFPARNVAGDFYDVFFKDEGHSELCLFVADASGKGVYACCYSLILKVIIKTYIKNNCSLEESIKKANDLFLEDTKQSGIFVTLFAAVYNKKTQLLSYYSCGHNPALLVKNSKEILQLDHPGAALGFLPITNAIYSKEILLNEGDILVIYSDGITEAHNAYDKLFGEERFISYLKQYASLPPKEIVDKLMQEIQLFSGSKAQHDDITLLIMKVKK